MKHTGLIRRVRFFVAVLLVRLRGEVLSRERTASWIREAVTP